MPPEILASTPELGATLVLDRPRKAWVKVIDDDDPLETLEYLWWLDDGTILSHDLLPDSDGTIVDLQVLPEYEGLTLHCQVLDSQDDFVEVEWPIEIVLEGT